MSKLQLYNKSSQGLVEIADESIDLIFIDPPFNIGTTYGNNSDITTNTAYMSLLSDTVSHATRVLKQGGYVILGTADTVIFSDCVFAQTAYFENAFSQLGLKLKQRHFGFESSEKNIQQMEPRWKEFFTKGPAHSNTLQYLVMQKTNAGGIIKDGKTYYENFKEEYGHPCPTPHKILEDVIAPLIFKDAKVLDMFMGTGGLGKLALTKGAVYIGYELDKRIFESTQSRLNVCSKATCQAN